MAKRLTDKDKKKIARDYSNNENLSETARMNDTTPTTVKRVIESDPQMLRKVKHKKEQNTNDILDYFDSKTNSLKNFSNYLMDDRLNPLSEENKEKLDNIPIRDLINAFGVIADKYIKVIEIKAKTKTDDTVEEINSNLKDLAEILKKPVGNREIPNDE